MKRQLLIVLIMVLGIQTSTFSQVITPNVQGHWILYSICHVNGNQLSDRLAKNYSFQSLEFLDGHTVKKAHVPLFDGFPLEYSVWQDILTIGVLHYSIEHVSADSLVLIEEGQQGYYGDALKMLFLPEKDYRDLLPLDTDKVYMLNGKTVYIEDQKVHAGFNHRLSYNEYILKNIRNSFKYVGTGEFFCASFIISESGNIDNVLIHKGLDPKFDKQFTEAVRKSSEFIIPGTLDEKEVSTLRLFYFPFSFSIGSSLFPYSDYYSDDLEKGFLELAKYNTQNAVDYFQKCLDTNPKNIEALYQMGRCSYLIGDKGKACEFWNEVNSYKSNRAKDVLKQTCK